MGFLLWACCDVIILFHLACCHANSVPCVFISILRSCFVFITSYPLFPFKTFSLLLYLIAANLTLMLICFRVLVTQIFFLFIYYGRFRSPLTFWVCEWRWPCYLRYFSLFTKLWIVTHINYFFLNCYLLNRIHFCMTYEVHRTGWF